MCQNYTLLNMSGAKHHAPISLRYLFLTFLKVGTLSFGGFMALIAVLQKQMVEKDKTLDNQVLLDGVSLASLLPGPLAVNTVGYVGYQLSGFWGGLLSMFAVTLPCFVLVLFFSAIYLAYGDLAVAQQVVSWFTPGVIVIILTVGLGMAQKHLTRPLAYSIAIGSFVVFQTVGGISATVIVMCTGAAIGYWRLRTEDSAPQQPTLPARKPSSQLAWQVFQLAAWLCLVVIGLYFLLAQEQWQMGVKALLTFSSMSLTLFGGGYVIIPIIQESIVDSLHWLTLSEFNTAIAISQITPGPILISSAFIGYKVAGVAGACLATIGIFLPSGLLMIVGSHWLARYKNLDVTQAIFKGLRPAVIGLIFSAAATIGLGSLHHWYQTVSLVILTVFALWFKLSTLWIMLGSLILGLIGLLL